MRTLSAASGSAPTVVDPGLPRLDLLLDDARLRPWLAERGQTLVTRNYLRYKPGTSCVLGLRLGSGWAFLLTAAPAAAPKLAKLAGRARPGQVLAFEPGPGLLLAGFRADRDLPGLADLDTAVADLLPGGSAAGEVETLVHKPQRRWVGRLATGSGPVVLRAYRRGRAEDARRRFRQARRRVDRAVEVPRVLAVARRPALLAIRHLTGTTLRAGSASAEQVAAAGAALARVHRADPSGLGPPATADPGETVDLVGALLPALRHRSANVLRSVLARRPAGGPEGLVHGDFSLDQVLARPDGTVAVLDWDRSGTASPAADLGSAIAAGLTAGHEEALLEGYTRVADLPRHLAWHVARARLLRLAEPFREASANWPAEIEARLLKLESNG